MFITIFWIFYSITVFLALVLSLGSAIGMSVRKEISKTENISLASDEEYKYYRNMFWVDTSYVGFAMVLLILNA